MQKVEGVDLGKIVADVKAETAKIEQERKEAEIKQAEERVRKHIMKLQNDIKLLKERAAKSLEEAKKIEDRLDRIAAGDWDAIGL